MSETRIRTAERRDLARITEIYNYYVLNTPVTFDVEAYTVEGREAWFAQFSATGRYRLVVAEEDGVVMGYAGTTRFRPKAAYETTVETTIYCAPEAVAKGVGRLLYARLRFRPKAAYETTVETTINCAPEAVAKVVGRLLSARLPFRPKAAYETTVETTINCAPEAVAKGVGRL